MVAPRAVLENTILLRALQHNAARKFFLMATQATDLVNKMSGQAGKSKATVGLICG